MGKFIDLTGQRFGKLIVNSYEGLIRNKPHWNCTCDCGKQVVVRGDQLKSGKTKSCGCFNTDYHKERYKELTGQRFGYWTVLFKAEKSDNGAYWHCRCDCGTEKDVKGTLLQSGESLSCGCYNREMSHQNAKHGMSRTRIYGIWQGMKDRCYNPNNDKYYLYGGRGIRVCEQWLGEHGFEHFYEWAIQNGYKEDLTIDRYPNKDGNYEPSNCRWADVFQQANNLSTNRLITYNGETHTLAEWSRIKGINRNTLNYRTRIGWDINRLFDPPKR